MFQLHERLAADTHKLGESRLCDVLLMNDNTWPWVILVPRISGIREIYELPNEQQQRLLFESSALSEGMMQLFGGDKMNVAALGNMVPQLHLHHIVRFEGLTSMLWACRQSGQNPTTEGLRKGTHIFD